MNITVRHCAIDWTITNTECSVILPSNLWRISCSLPNRLERTDFDPILCTSTRKDRLHIDCTFDSEAMRTARTATLDRQRFVRIRGSWERLCGGGKVNDKEKFVWRKIEESYLKVSDELFPESAVLDGFVPLSKLNVFGLSECGDAVVELAIHNLESVIVFCMVVLVVVEE